MNRGTSTGNNSQYAPVPAAGAGTGGFYHTASNATFNSSGNLQNPTIMPPFHLPPPPMMPIPSENQPFPPCVPYPTPFMWPPFPRAPFHPRFPCMPPSIHPNLQSTSTISQTFIRKSDTDCQKEQEKNTFLVIQKQFFTNTETKLRDAPRIQLWKISEQIQEFYKSLAELERMIDELETCDVESVGNWDHLCEEITTKKEKLISLKQSLNFNETVVQELKFKINKRRKKRKSKKKMKVFRKNIPSKYEIAEQHMQKLIQDASKVEQDEKFKKEADNILSSVLQKKNEARNQISLLTALQKLHSARINVLNSEKNRLTMTPEVSGFENVTEKLISLWQAKMKEYQVEESGLRIMLEAQAVNAEDEECMKLKKTFGKWLKFIFGTTDLSKESFYTDMNEFVQIRQEWDKYITEKSEHSSKIPGGWIVPKYNSDEAWRKFVH